MTDLTAARTSPRLSRRGKGFLGYLDLYRQRRALAALDDTQLLDLGLTRDEALREANRSIWDAPNHWYD
ncbi:DUF1127 domain-containing protein [Litoreibacter sp.]|nr:DUF1127 domain-containing protein [Litoreibacter sp.]